MKLSEFDIDFIKFKNETDEFHFKINDAFFDLKENSLYQFCDIDIDVVCTRNDGNIKLDYQFNGVVFVQCERCLKNIEMEILANRTDVLRLTSNDELLLEENYISVNNQVYNVYDSLYEQICLSMPIRKICELSKSQKACEIEHPTTEKNEEVDERWAELKKLIK